MCPFHRSLSRTSSPCWTSSRVGMCLKTKTTASSKTSPRKYKISLRPWKAHLLSTLSLSPSLTPYIWKYRSSQSRFKILHKCRTFCLSSLTTNFTEKIRKATAIQIIFIRSRFHNQTWPLPTQKRLPRIYWKPI